MSEEEFGSWGDSDPVDSPALYIKEGEYSLLEEGDGTYTLVTPEQTYTFKDNIQAIRHFTRRRYVGESDDHRTLRVKAVMALSK